VIDQRMSARDEWKRNWPTVASAMVGMYLCVTFLYSAGIFVAPLEAEFGWTREEISRGVMIVSFSGAFIHPISGILGDRFGARRVALPGVVAFCLAIATCSLAGPSIWSWWLCTLLCGLTFGMIGSAIWVTGAIAGFEKSRGKALAVMQLGPGLALATLPIIGAASIAAFGWRVTFQLFALGGVLIALPAVYFGFIDRRRSPGDDAMPGPEKIAVPGWTQREIFRSPQFMKLAGATFLAVMGLNGMSIHFVPILADAGITLGRAAAVASLIGFGSISGRLIGGAVLDYVDARIVAAISFSLPVLVSLLLLFAGDDTLRLSLAAYLLGLSVGAEVDVIAYLAARYFGMRNYGVAWGFISAAMAFGSGTGSWLGGLAHDRFGNYQAFEGGLIASFVVAVVLITTMGCYTDFEGAGAPASSGRRASRSGRRSYRFSSPLDWHNVNGRPEWLSKKVE
jgi:predicted MFS family arabinose efflux permease